MDWEKACQILGVAPTASADEIKGRWRFWVNVLHPDKTSHLTQKLREQAVEQFKLAVRAYEYLADPLNNPLTNPPKLKVSPKHIRFRAMEVGQKKTTSFEIDSIGGAYTNIWFEGEPCPWLSVTSFRSTSTTDQLPMEVTIECTGTGEPGKQYSCKLPVRLENAKTKLKDEVVLDIELWTKAERPALYADISRIQFTGVIAGTREAHKLALGNIGHGVLEGATSTSRAWLSVLPSSVKLTQGGSSSYAVVVNTDNLPPGFVDRGEVYIRTNGGVATVVVDLSVAHPAGRERHSYSVTVFLKRFFLVLVFPFIPPIIVPTIYLLGYLAERSLVWMFVAPLIIAAIALANRQAAKEAKASTPVAWFHQKRSITATPAPTAAHPPGPAQSTVTANAVSLVYHRPSCEWARKISRRNRVHISKDKAIGRGYRPCSVCRP